MSDSWYKVDNVAKVFLATASQRDPRVFRISCTLNEEIDPNTLNEARAAPHRNGRSFRSRCTAVCSGIILSPPTSCPPPSRKPKPPAHLCIRRSAAIS